jgi:sugar phosphate isomerase/epimerase
VNPITLAAPALSDAPPLDLVDAAAFAGFAGLGLRISRSRVPGQPFYPIVGNTRLIADIKRRLADSNLQLLELYSFYLTPDFRFDAFRAALETGAELGARYAVVLGYDPDEARARDTFARMCDVAVPLGLSLAVEFAPVADCRPATLEQALRLLREVDRSNSVVMPDPAHLFRSGGAIAELRAARPGEIQFSQICDMEIVGEEPLATLGRAVPKLKRRPVGQGLLRVDEWLNALPAGIPISVECVPQPEGMSYREWARVLYQSTRAALERHYAARPADSLR